MRLSEGSIVDAIVINTPASTKNADNTNRRPTRNRKLTEDEKERNSMFSKTCVRVEHVFGVARTYPDTGRFATRVLRRTPTASMFFLHCRTFTCSGGCYSCSLRGIASQNIGEKTEDKATGRNCFPKSLLQSSKGHKSLIYPQETDTTVKVLILLLSSTIVRSLLKFTNPAHI